uniref:Tyrosine specific protein phosphatases domain-containing protein n=1 Tax=Poecilia latipinna TaxID=48699 RepID=A0A3B3UPR7_9TELE
MITNSVLVNRVKVAQDMPRGLGSMASPEVQAGSYETPTASELHRLMWTKKGGNNRMDEVYPRIYIGDMYAAKDKRTLQAHHITHVLNAADGKYNVFVHCAMGLSRSSTLVLAYLMIHENMTLVDAIKAVSANRNVSPNEGFLEQLRRLDTKLHCH